MKTIKTKAYRDLLKGHKDAIIALHSPYGPNSGFLYSASSDGFIRGFFSFFNRSKKILNSLEFA